MEKCQPHRNREDRVETSGDSTRAGALQGGAGLTERGGAGRGRAGKEVQFPDAGKNKAFVAQPESGGNAEMSRASSGQLSCQQPP